MSSIPMADSTDLTLRMSSSDLFSALSAVDSGMPEIIKLFSFLISSLFSLDAIFDITLLMFLGSFSQKFAAASGVLAPGVADFSSASHFLSSSIIFASLIAACFSSVSTRKIQIIFSN